ncbi:MAG: TIR domain-containing protein [Anaerolinea sp.]|nr:TIR domain-containing protein [Anaerolinea sp.]
MANIFISYSRKDEAFARRLATALSLLGADVWIDLEDIPVGVKWSTAIQQGLNESEVMIVIISPDSMASTNVEDEWQYYLDQRKVVVPVLLRPANIHFQLNRFQWINFNNRDFNIAFEELHRELSERGFTFSHTPDDVKKQTATMLAASNVRVIRRPDQRTLITTAVVVVIAAVILIGGLALLNTRNQTAAIVPSDTPSKTFTPSHTPTEGDLTFQARLSTLSRDVIPERRITLTLPDGLVVGGAQLLPTSEATETPQPTDTNTPVPPTATETPQPTDTNTPVPPTATETPQPTDTNTPIPPTATETPRPTDTDTPIPPTATETPRPTDTNTPRPTRTPSPTATPSATSTLTPTVAPPVRLVYDQTSFVLHNQSSRPISLTSMLFIQQASSGLSISFNSSMWIERMGSNPILGSGACVQLLVLGTTLPPRPDYCRARAVWIAVGSSRWFWVSSAENAAFEVRQLGDSLAACSISAGECAVYFED